MAEDEYQRLLEEARGGDEDAINQLLGFVNSYLEIAQGVEKSSKAYEIRYNQVLADLNSIGAEVTDRAKDSFDEANQRLAELGLTVVDFGDSIATAIENISTRLEEYDAILNPESDFQETYDGMAKFINRQLQKK